MTERQLTIARPVTYSGIGLHTGDQSATAPSTANIKYHSGVVGSACSIPGLRWYTD